MTKWVYSFGNGSAEGDAAMKNLLGGKGANLAEMSNLGLPVPPGFTITTEVCTYYYAHDEAYPADLKSAVEAALASVGKIADGKLGDPAKPLLRFGALRRARFDAGHDGYGAQSRPQRRDDRRACKAHRRSRALPMIPIAASSRCIPTSCSAWSMRCSRKSSTRRKKTKASNSTPNSMPTI